MYTVGSVPYANAKPLIWWFEQQGAGSPVRVLYDVPSKLPALLDSGVADAVLASSYESLVTPGRRIAAGLCIASDGPVMSVRLFSKVGPGDIRTLSLDRSSMTSNVLAEIILAERFGVRPATITAEPDLDAMLSHSDAAVIIGDNGMAAVGEGLHILDLGSEWKKLTGLPFVWAMWIGGAGLTPHLSWLLRHGMTRSEVGAWTETETVLCERMGIDRQQQERMRDERRSRLIQMALSIHWPEQLADRYLAHTMKYQMGDREMEGLREFQRRLLALGKHQASHFPASVDPEPGHGSVAALGRKVAPV